MKSKMYSLRCVTNMHIGSGDDSYGLVDNRVEKDVVLGTPIIPASSIKGSLRDFLSKDKFNSKDIIEIFGSAPNDGDSKSGKIHFLSANLLFRPMRVSSGNCSYCLVTTTEILSNMMELYKHLGSQSIDFDKELNEINEKLKDKNGIYFADDNLEVEGYRIERNQKFSIIGYMKKIIGENYNVPIVIMKPKIFNDIDLPVIARNKLNDGKSENLWYEEIVPHQSIFYFGFVYEDRDKELVEKLNKKITETTIQFGGNASIGYGFSKIKELKLGGEKDAK